MNIYLTPYELVGPAWWPVGTFELSAWSGIDLRPANWCLVGTEETITDVRALSLGANAWDTRSAARRTLLQSRLGLTLTSDRFREMLAEVLIEHARTDGTRWRGLRLTRNGRYEAWLGGQKIVDVGAIRGGSSATESFDTGDTSTLGPNQTWTEISGAWSVASNTAQCDTANGNVTARCDFSVSSNDMYAFATMARLPSDGNRRYGVATRFSAVASVETAYLHTWSGPAGRYELYKVIAGNLTALNVGGTTTAVNDVIRGESNGSVQTTFRNGVSQATGTDTSIDGTVIGGKRGGLYCNNAGGATTGRFDVFEVGDLGGAVEPDEMTRARVFMSVP